ncbi:MAG: hypothetical protein IJ158_01830 [Treponema sp.]|nr:hypothetical protein [Treponema sp.]
MDKDELYRLKRELYKWAKQNLRGTVVKNEATSNLIEISTQGIDEWFSKSKSEEQIKSISLLTEILKNAKLSHSAKNFHSERKNAPSFEYYECPIEIDEKGFTAVISIKIIIANIGNRRIYYHHYLDDIKNQTALNSCVPTYKGNNTVLLDGSE